MSDVDLSKQLNKSPNALRIKASRLNIKKYSSIYRSKLQLNEKEEQVIIGGLLGDLHCRKTRTSKNPRLEGGHGSRQRDYALYKIKLLKRLNWVGRNSRDGSYHYLSKSYPCLNKYYGIFYRTNKKTINENILDKINELGLLIWYMDDGSYHKRDKTTNIYTNCFTIEEQKIIKGWFEKKWGIYPKIHKTKDPKNYPDKIWYYLYFPVNETKKLHNLFHNLHIPECMKYKFSFFN